MEIKKIAVRGGHTEKATGASALIDELTEDNIVKSRTGFKDTLIWNKLYKFQKDGVMGAIDKIEK